MRNSTGSPIFSDFKSDQEGGVNSTARAYPMILAIVTSLSVKRGILLGFENGAGDVVGC